MSHHLSQLGVAPAHPMRPQHLPQPWQLYRPKTCGIAEKVKLFHFKDLLMKLTPVVSG